MAAFFTSKLWVFAVTLLCMSMFCFYLGKAEYSDEDLPQTGTVAGEDLPQTGTVAGEDLPQTGTVAGEDLPQTGTVAGEDLPQTGAVAGEDLPQIVSKALLCFNDKYIYSSCEETYRLTASGNLDVPPDYINNYCHGPCLSETHLVLNCIENIMKHFHFYNRATVPDIRDTIKAGCGYGPERGKFNVAEHIEADEDSANKAATHILFGIGSMIMGLILLL